MEVVDWLICRLGDTVAAKLLYRRVGIAHKNIANSSFSSRQCRPYIDCVKKNRAGHGYTQSTNQLSQLNQPNKLNQLNLSSLPNEMFIL